MRIGFVGAGNVAEFHFRAFREAGAEVSCVCTRGDSGRDFSTQHNLRYYSSLSAMLNTENLQAIALLTHPESYPELLIEIKERNIPTFIEKPVSYSFEKALEVKKILPSITMVGQNRRFYSNIKQIIPELSDQISVSAHVFINERAIDIRKRNKQDRNSWHVMNAIHGVDLLKFLFGSPVTFEHLSHWGQLDFSSLKQFNSAVFSTENLHRVYFHSNFDSPGGWKIDIYKNDLTINIFPIERTTITTTANGQREVEISNYDKDFKQGFFDQAKCFIKGATTGHYPADWVHFDDALESIRITEILYDTLGRKIS